MKDAPAKSVRNMLCPLCKRGAGCQITPVLSSRRKRQTPQSHETEYTCNDIRISKHVAKNANAQLVASCILQS